MSGDRAKNQIDLICISQRWCDGLLSAKTIPGADCGSEHAPVMAIRKLKLKQIKRSKWMEMIDRQVLCCGIDFTAKFRKTILEKKAELLKLMKQHHSTRI